MSKAKDKKSGLGIEGPGLFGRIINAVPEFTAPSRKVDDDVKDFNTPKSNMTSVVKTQNGDTITWELYDNDKYFTNGKKVLEVTDDGGGLRIHIGPDKPILGFVDGMWVVMGKPMERVEKVPGLDMAMAAEMLNMGTTITDVADMSVQPTGEGKNDAAHIVAARTARMEARMKADREAMSDGEHVVGEVMGKLGKKYLDSIRPTESEDPTPTNSDKDDDTAAPGITESAEGWYGGGDPQDDGEDGGDEQDEDDEYDRAKEVSSDIWSQKHYTEHCQHCALKDPALAFSIVKTRMEHRAELIISLRTTARELLIQSGIKEEMKSILRRFTLDNTLLQTERLEVSDVMGEGYEDALIADRREDYDVVQMGNYSINDDIGNDPRWRVGQWIKGHDGVQILMTCEVESHGPIAGDRYASYEMARNAVEILNGKGKDDE